MITERQKALIKETIPVLKENGVALTTHFYKRMFSHNPELKNVFNMGNQANGRQQLSLALAVLAYAENIEDPSVLLGAVNKIGHKHASLNIQPEQYDIVGHHLLASIKEVLGDNATNELLTAWGVAYNQLAALMIGTEEKIYKTRAAAEGGWNGWRSFVVRKKVKESDEITSFYLYPEDGQKTIYFIPGQFLSLRLYLPSLNLLQPRQYSITSSPDDPYYRISVKREPGTDDTPEGMVSSTLHNEVGEGMKLEVSAPAGDFHLTTDKETPLVFISGGVGQTPFISMLQYILAHQPDRKVVWLHACRNINVHAFKNFIEKCDEEMPDFSFTCFYEELSNENDHFQKGYILAEHLKNIAEIDNAEYYICGPLPFIDRQKEHLASLGVVPGKIFFEEFGPGKLAYA